MQELSVEQVKKIEIDILDYVNQICIEHQLTYYLSWGTLLGAVRHKGFIPWDDDIDIIMPREDYTKLINILAAKNDNYRFLCYKTEKDYYYPFGKIVDMDTLLIESGTISTQQMGIYIDVFPLDHLPDDIQERRRHQNKCWNLRQIWGHAIAWKNHSAKRNILYYFGCMACAIYGWRRSISQLDNLASSIKGPTRYVAELLDCLTKNSELDSEWFSSSIMLEFEGKKYPCPVGYKEYLTDCYGNYMQLPPIEKRVSGHNFKAYIRT